ncbi:hypothetical protein [Algoriphagus antarcticus]|uniref:Uncharacterized protein n=1 Tax=Algoriphagus antarcticus TaxID=238540 RepID=A0A3E0E109_9BACT|nr:hypothetical protein [Algoriphagus antarcticus]REG90586.1 hypothetical protein C8N25_10684 [Algoriphagus antarcticus]
MLDGVIALTVILFILSIVSEKFIQLIRSYPQNFPVILIIIAVFLIPRGFYNIIQNFSGANLSIFDSYCAKTLQVFSIISNILFLISFFFFLSIKGEKIFFKNYKSYNSLFFLALSFLFFALSISLTKYTWHILFGGIFLFSSLVSLGIMYFDKLYIGSKKYSLKFFERINKDFLMPKNSEEKEKKENEITLLSMFIGVLIAFAFKANFFSLIKDLRKIDNKISIGWNENEFPFQYQIESHLFNLEIWNFEVSFFIGILLTGFFLSFGSKFFHDLLDRLYYAKKASQALNDPEIMDQTSAEKVAEFVDKYNISKIYHRYKSILLNEPEITSISIQNQFKNQKANDYLMISLEGKTPAGFEDKIRKLINDDEILIQFENNINDFKLTLGNSFADSISNAKTTTIQGSVALEVQDENDPHSNYILTCFHVVKHSNHTWQGQLASDESENRIIFGSGRQPNGTIVKAYRSNIWECALIKLDTELELATLESLIKVRIKGYKILDDSSIINKNAYMYSRVKSSNQKAEILSHASTIEIDFEDGPFQMYDLIKVWNTKSQLPIQEYGDSGNLLYDQNGYALGIVFAKSNQFTYAMDINFPLKYFHIKIKTS